jgi:two-component system, LuxR family, sensor kinase FixL
LEEYCQTTPFKKFACLSDDFAGTEMESEICNSAVADGATSFFGDASEAFSSQHVGHLYHTLIESLPQHVFFKDRDSVFLSVNAAFAADFRRSPAEFIGKTDRDFFPKELAEKYLADDQRVMFRRRPETIEEINITNGKKRYVEVTKAPVLDDNGEVIGLLGVFTDVTERRNTQQELAKEQALLRTLVENIPDRIFYKDTRSRYIWASPSLLKELNINDPSEIIGRSEADFYSEEEAQQRLKDEQNLLEGGVALVNKIEEHSCGGQKRWSAVTKVPVTGEDGRIVGLIGISRDITSLKQAEEEMKRSQAFLNSVIENLPITVFIKRADDLKFVLWNKAGEELTGRPAADFVGKSDHDFFPKDEAEYYIARDREALLSKTLVETPEETMSTPHKGARIVHTKKIPILNESGEPEYLLGIAEDITERKAAQEKLEKFTAQLKQNNRELQDFAYVASHDLQEPLRKVRAFGDRLRTKCGPAFTDEGRDYLERMLNAARRMQILIEDLLEFSRVTTRAQPFVAVDLNRVAREVVSDLEVRIEQVHGRVEIGELPTLEADPTQMRQLLQNLIGNALKFHRKDETPVVKLRAELLSSGDTDRLKRGMAPAPGRCQLFIEDNGIGFEEKYLDRIFTVFQRLHGRGEYEGTGVGLAICRKIAVRHGGDITAKSQPGTGATFIVSLPLKQPKIN